MTRGSKGLIIVLFYFAVSSVIYLNIVPPFEAPDEAGHIAYVNFIQMHRALPNQLVDSLHEPLQGHQPPLYYLVLYGVNYVFNNDSPVDNNLKPNLLHVWNGGTENHVPVYIHKPGEKNIDSVFYLMRCLSVLFGIITIIFVFRAAYLVFQNVNLAILAAFLTASLPQFAFMSSVVNNDSLVNMLSAGCIYFLLRAISRPGQLQNYVLIFFYYGLALLTKKSSAFLFVLILITGIIVFVFPKTSRKIVIRGFFLGAITFALIGGMYFYRNYIIYGEFIGLREELITFGKLQHHSLFSSYFLRIFPNELFKSFTAYPGVMNILMPVYIYLFYAIVLISALAGLVLRIRSAFEDTAHFVILAAGVLISLGSVVYFNTLLTQPQGRFLFTALVPVVLILTAGLKNFASLFENIVNPKYAAAALIIALIISQIIAIIVTNRFFTTPAQYSL